MTDEADFFDGRTGLTATVGYTVTPAIWREWRGLGDRFWLTIAVLCAEDAPMHLFVADELRDEVAAIEVRLIPLVSRHAGFLLGVEYRSRDHEAWEPSPAHRTRFSVTSESVTAEGADDAGLVDWRALRLAALLEGLAGAGQYHRAMLPEERLLTSAAELAEVQLDVLTASLAEAERRNATQLFGR